MSSGKRFPVKPGMTVDENYRALSEVNSPILSEDKFVILVLRYSSDKTRRKPMAP